jgi:hypothetical protein
MREAADSKIFVQQTAPRSKSAEIIRSKPFANALNELTLDSVKRLNAVLSVGMSQPPQRPSTVDRKDVPQGGRDVQVSLEPLLCKAHDFSHLSILQDTLGKALTETVTPKNERLVQKPLRSFKHFRNSSNGSVSTMAPDDASECEDLSRNGLGRMPHVWSSGSVSSMVSNFDDHMSEAGEVQFGLNIEEYSQIEDWRASAKESTSTGRGKKYCGPKDFSHSLVPRNQNLVEMHESNGKQAAPTTLMIRNIPSRYSQQDLMMDLKDLGFAGTLDFLYIPMDTSTLASVGYGFVNFKDPVWAEKCMQAFQNFRFRRHRRGAHKLASTSIAHMQGLEKNLRHYERSAVNSSIHTSRRPIVMASIDNMFG